jgi:hypothetical protein
MASIKMLGGTIMIFLVLSLVLKFGEATIAARLGLNAMEEADLRAAHEREPDGADLRSAVA